MPLPFAQAASDDERKRHEAAAQELLDGFISAVKGENTALLGGGAKRGLNEHHQKSTLEKVAERASELWVPRLEDLHDVLSAGLDVRDVAGFSLDPYNDHMREVLVHLAVLPTAARLVFWDRVQRAEELNQTLGEDFALQEYLRHLCFGMTFEALPPGIHRPPPPRPHGQFLHGRRASTSPGIAPMMLPAKNARQTSRWGVATLFPRGTDRAASCEPPFTGVKGVRDPPFVAGARKKPFSSHCEPEVTRSSDSFHPQQRLQVLIDKRHSLQDQRLNSLKFHELEDYEIESKVLAKATISSYADHLPSRPCFAHGGRELKGWTSPREWEPPTGRFSLADFEGSTCLPAFGSGELPGEVGLTMEDAVDAVPAPTDTIKPRVPFVCYNREELLPVFEKRRSREAAAQRRFEAAVDLRQAKIEHALRMEEQRRLMLNRRAVEKQVRAPMGWAREGWMSTPAVASSWLYSYR